MNEGKIKCPNCEGMVNTYVVEAADCFDEIIYDRRCENCNHIIESFSMEKK